MRRKLTISTNFDYPPIPMRTMDWSAVWDDCYDGAPDGPAHPIGHGETEIKAIQELLEMTEPEYLEPPE